MWKDLIRITRGGGRGKSWKEKRKVLAEIRSWLMRKWKLPNCKSNRPGVSSTEFCNYKSWKGKHLEVYGNESTGVFLMEIQSNSYAIKIEINLQMNALIL